MHKIIFFKLVFVISSIVNVFRFPGFLEIWYLRADVTSFEYKY